MGPYGQTDIAPLTLAYAAGGDKHDGGGRAELCAPGGDADCARRSQL